MTLCQALGHNVVHKTIAIRERMARLLAANAGRGGCLLERHGVDKEVDLMIAKGGVGAM
jgi:hypothetical protein